MAVATPLHLQLADLQVEVVRKPIRSLRLTVYAPDGRVRATAPLRTTEAAIRQFILDRRTWIQKQQAKFRALERPAALTYVSGEVHYYQGQAYELQVHTTTSTARVALGTDQHLHLYARPDSTQSQRKKLLDDWYRARLKEQLPALLARWQPVVGKQAATWGVKQMRTRWGTCNIQARRIWLNLELIKRPLPCLEYVVVHELVHLHERHHNARFWGFMDQFMPPWRQYKQELNRTVLGLAAAADAD